MRCMGLTIFFAFLSASARIPESQPDPAFSLWFPAAEWTPMAVTLLESTETEWGSIATARVTRRDSTSAAPTQSDSAAVVRTDALPSVKADTPAPASPPEPTAPPAVAIEYAKVGETVKLAVTTDGTPPFTYQWLKNGQLMPQETGALLTIENATLEHAGNYECVVKNSAGNKTSQPIKLVIRPE